MQEIDPERLNRTRGALVGLACGDALGTTLEFRAPGSFEPINDMVGGGPFNLAKGQWTDDTSMALCLAASLVGRGRCEPRDQLARFLKWRDEGYMSCTGRCFDIGSTVNAALARFEATNDPACGSQDARSSGNGALMRLAPVIIFSSKDNGLALKQARITTRTTHASDLCVDASDLFGMLLWMAINGCDKEHLLDSGFINIEVGRQDRHPSIAAIMDGSFKHRSPPEIRGTGFVVQSLEAALWAFYHHDDFESGALAAANLGDDADTTAAIYGQLAGAHYGLDAIPAHWRKYLAWHQSLVDLADALALGWTRANISRCATKCAAIAAAPELETLFDLLEMDDQAWAIQNYMRHTLEVDILYERTLGLAELAARITWFSRGEKFCDGFWDANVEDYITQRFFKAAAQRLNALVHLIDTGRAIH